MNGSFVLIKEILEDPPGHALVEFHRLDRPPRDIFVPMWLLHDIGDSRAAVCCMQEGWINSLSMQAIIKRQAEMISQVWNEMSSILHYYIFFYF